MEERLEIGLTLTKKFRIKAKHAANRVGSGQIEVLSTPSMIGFMEETSLNCVQPKLEDGEITVGTRVDVKHLYPAPIGEMLQVTSQLVEVNKKKLTFIVKAELKNKLIGQGQHERVVVNKELFLQKLKQKME